ncbi:flippase-like domain-containing protein [bacterium]|nr:flippase-like domain-containing protein [bacterium]
MKLGRAGGEVSGGSRRGLVLHAVKVGFAVVLFAALVWWVSPADLLEVLSAVSLQEFSILLLISAVLVSISVFKWQGLLHAQGRHEALPLLFRLYLIGYFVNLILPSFVGGDALRSWYLGKRHGQSQAAAATFLERYSGLLAMLLLGLIGMWSSKYIQPSLRVPLLLFAGGFAVFSFLLVSERALSLAEHIPQLGERVVKAGKAFQDAIRFACRSPFAVVQALLYSLLFHAVAIGNIWACAVVVGWGDIPITEMIVVLPVILIISAIPLTPQGLGLQEGAFLYYLTALGATPQQAMGVAIIIRAKSYILAGVGGVLWYFEPQKLLKLKS